MNPHRARLAPLGAVIFTIGILLASTLTFLASWADLEATFYGFLRMASNPVTTLDCPIFLTSAEPETISVRFVNSSDVTTRPTIRADLSSSGPLLSYYDSLEVPAGEEQRLEWKVTARNVDMERFVFAKVLFYATYPLPTRESSCGIYFFNTRSLTGADITWGLFISGTLGILAGMLVWNRSLAAALPARTIQLKNAVTTLGVITLAGEYSAYAGMWLLGVILLALTVLMVAVIFFFIFSSPPDKTRA